MCRSRGSLRRGKGKGEYPGDVLSPSAAPCAVGGRKKRTMIHTDLELVAQVYILYAMATLSTDIHYSINFEFTQQQANNCTTNIYYIMKSTFTIHPSLVLRPSRNAERGSGVLSDISWCMGRGRSRILKLESDGITLMT